MAAALLACTDTRTAVCLNGVRCPADFMCVEPYGYCALPEDVEPCLNTPENMRCEYHGFDVGICRRGVCELDNCADSTDCNDGNPCTRDTCVGDRCERAALDGVSCNDDKFCNGADTCVAGACTGHSGDPCTRGNTYCDPAQNACAGCTPGGDDCPEGIHGEWSDCTGADGTCSQDGLQTRTAITFTCNSERVCEMREGTETQTCIRRTDGVSCSDGNLCTTNDQCTGGACGGQAKVCYDGKECTTDTCSPTLDCQYIPVPFGERCGFGNCDGLGGCVTCGNVGEACGTANPCERGEIRCVGGAPVCVPVGPAAAGTVCKAAEGACDLPEVCNGADTICPADRFQQGTTCRPAAGTCDVAETCTGTSAACPDDAFLPPTTTCRPATDLCDIAETCTGTDAACPDDAFLPPTTTCRPATDLCDIAETCTGTDAACPDNALHPAGTVCRAAADACDIREMCNGSSASCPADDPGCATDEYCFNAQCFASPSIDIQGTDEGNELCSDLGIAHPAPGFISRVIFQGRAGAAFRYLRRHVSCPDSFFAQAPVDCSETGPGEDTVLPPGGTCTYDISNPVPLTDCPTTIAGRWEVYAEVDGVAESNHDFAHIYNSTVSCPANPPPTTCAAAFSFCPCTGACNAATCPSPGVCTRALLLPLDRWGAEECDAGVTSNTYSSFSTVEGVE